MFTGLAAILGVVYAVSQPRCGTGETAPAWSGTVDTATLILIGLGLLFGGAAAIGGYKRVAVTALLVNSLMLMILFFTALNSGLC